MTYGAEFLVSAAKKAVHAMRRQCIFLGLSDPASICKLFDTLVLSILAYSCEVWAVDPKVAEGAEQLHTQFLKQLLGIRKSISNLIILAEFGRLPLQFHFWQQILRYHNRAVHLSNDRLVKRALIDDFYQFTGDIFRVEVLSNNWRSGVRRLVSNHPGQRAILGELDASSILNREKELYLFNYHNTVENSSLQTYRELNPHYQYAEYLSNISCYPNRRSVSRCRCQCSGLRIDTGRFEQLSRDQRVCPFCHSCTEDVHHFLFDCPSYNNIRTEHPSLFQHTSVASFLNTDQHSMLGGFLRKCHTHRLYLLGLGC